MMFFLRTLLLAAVVAAPVFVSAQTTRNVVRDTATTTISGGSHANHHDHSASGHDGAATRPTKKAAPKRLVFSFQKSKDPRQIREDAKAVSQYLEAELGIPVDIEVPSSYAATVQALISERAHVGYMDSLPYLLASAEAPMKILVAEVREGRTDYDSIFVVKKDSPFQTLQDLEGKRMIFTSPTSTSGYVMAYNRLVNEDILEPRQDPKDFFGRVNFAGGYDRAIAAVFNGQADLAAASYYAFEGPRADVYTTPEMREDLRVLTRTPGVPTHLVAARSDLPDSLLDDIKAALLKLSEENPDLLGDVYGASEFVSVDESHVDKSREAIEQTGLGLNRIVNK